jgi:hypothetical protein
MPQPSEEGEIDNLIDRADLVVLGNVAEQKNQAQEVQDKAEECRWASSSPSTAKPITSKTTCSFSDRPHVANHAKSARSSPC